MIVNPLAIVWILWTVVVNYKNAISSDVIGWTYRSVDIACDVWRAKLGCFVTDNIESYIIVCQCNVSIIWNLLSVAIKIFYLWIHSWYDLLTDNPDEAWYPSYCFCQLKNCLLRCIDNFTVKWCFCMQETLLGGVKLKKKMYV